MTPYDNEDDDVEYENNQGTNDERHNLDYDGSNERHVEVNHNDDDDDGHQDESPRHRELFLHTEELAWSGEELEEYCQKHGLCQLCAQTKTHKRVFRLKKKNQWQPLTVKSTGSGASRSPYVVYKGYCLQPGCFTLEQAQRLLGEIGPSAPVDDDQYYQSTPAAADVGTTANGDNGDSNGTADGGKKKKGISRLLRGRRSKNGGSTAAEDMTGKRKNKKALTTAPAAFDSGFSGFSTVGGNANMRSVKTSKTRSSSGRSSHKSSSGRSIGSEIRRADDDMSVGSAMTSESKVRSSLRQLLQENMGTMLDVSNTRLHHVHVTELNNSLSVATTLHTLILENCKLNDNEVEIIGNGLASDDMAAPITRLSFRSNRIGNRGAVSLAAFFRKSSILQELDLSKNQIGSRGAMATLHAFRDNPNPAIKMINFAHNEIWDPDDGSFFAKNCTLQLLNLEGNFIHDEGADAIAKGLIANARNTKLSELYMGWNGIGDEGFIQLARMLESNKTLLRIGVGENDITSIGARALLSSLALNSTLREVTGLYHNQIDRKFIIACIKRLLYSHVETVSSEYEAQQKVQLMMEASLNAMDSLAEPLGSALPPPDEVSESSLDWAEKLYAPGEDAKAPILEINAPGVPLGNFDKKMEHDENCTCEVCVNNREKASASVESEKPGSEIPVAVKPKKSRYAEMPPPKAELDRLTVFQSAPLAYFDKETGLHHAFPLHDFDYEKVIIQHALEGALKLDRTIELEVEAATVDTFKTFIASRTSRVMHFSCFGHPTQILAFENGEGYLDTTMNVELLKTLIESAKTKPQLVVVNSFHSGRIGKAFLDAGVPHVICCHHTEVFRDKAACTFTKNLYRALSLNKSLKQSFEHAQEAVRVEEISKHVERYVLLPQKTDDPSYHDVPIFYTENVPANGLSCETEKQIMEEAREMLPVLPKHFIGREVDICHVLEALRIDNVVRIGGVKGSGKTSLVAAVCRYVQQRFKTFKFDDVFWLPPAHGVLPEQDTLYGDLSELMFRIIKSDHNISQDEDAMECKERIDIELEGRRVLLAIDSRKFETTAATENLENLLSDLLASELDVKVILISPSSDLQENEEENEEEEDEEDDTVRVGPIDFKSTSLLFGEISRFITANGCPAAQSPDEFAALMVPPSVAKLQDQTKFTSTRRSRLMSQIGNGLPSDIIRAAKDMPASSFIHLIGMANTPEVRIDSANALTAATAKWKGQLDAAVMNKNYLRAMDLDQVLKELESMKSKFPSLEDLVAKEQELHRRHTQCFKTRQYEEGNRLKREILTLKKRIMQEKRAVAAQHTTVVATPDKITNLQAQMDSIMRMANSSFSSLNELETPDRTEAVFSLGSAYHNCEVRIYPGNVCDFDPGQDLGATICWTNECCDLGLDDGGKTLLEYGGRNLKTDIGSLPGITQTPWGIAKCGTGNAVIVGPGNYDDLRVHCVILAVGPMSPSCDDKYEEDDEDSLHYIKVMMRSCIRSGLILSKHSQVHSIAFPTLTAKMGTSAYEPTLLTNLKILVEETKHSDLNNLHIVARSDEEASKLIGMALELGLSITE
ncbi:leucine rich repeat LRR-containing protein [Nitzschia inconspicua]|uniref:Leucine rich repeat LRR-containing protein n=1 Tax=Nitzschia inconspicua TaxID=303405 RepID=A0A9K3M3I0_9STRA|nr:leucine rich repeat LRR-containing protein [Nitzschia inconspicua]